MYVYENKMERLKIIAKKKHLLTNIEKIATITNIKTLKRNEPTKQQRKIFVVHTFSKARGFEQSRIDTIQYNKLNLVSEACKTQNARLKRYDNSIEYAFADNDDGLIRCGSLYECPLKHIQTRT